MFRRTVHWKGSERISFYFEGRELRAQETDSVAAALLANGIADFRTTAITGEARGPYCMMGTCFECLVEIDGIPNRQACQCKVKEGMLVERQSGVRRVQE